MDHKRLPQQGRQSTPSRPSIFSLFSGRANPPSEARHQAVPRGLKVNLHSLPISRPGDQYEQEADKVGRQVLSEMHPLQAEPLSTATHSVQNMVNEPEENRDALHQSVPSKNRMALAASLHPFIQSIGDGGHSLPKKVRVPLEQAFGADFHHVKMHTDRRSDQLNRSLQARAFTLGQHVFFRQGMYHPEDRSGQQLIAHELTHVVQQSRGTELYNSSDMYRPKVHLKSDSMIQRSEFQLRGETKDTVNYLGSELQDLLAELLEAGDLESLVSLRDALEEDQDNPPEITGLSPEEVTALLTMTRKGIGQMSKEEEDLSLSEGEDRPPSKEKKKNVDKPLPVPLNIYGPTPDKEPPGLFVLYRSMSANGVQRILKSLDQGKGPGLGNKRHKISGEPVGENFYASDLNYAQAYLKKGKRNKNGTATLRFALHPEVEQTLLLNPKFARAHESTYGVVKGLKKMRAGERGTILVKDEALRKGSMKYSRNYGLRETENPSSADNPYTHFNKYIISINIVV